LVGVENNTMSRTEEKADLLGLSISAILATIWWLLPVRNSIKSMRIQEEPRLAIDIGNMFKDVLRESRVTD